MANIYSVDFWKSTSERAVKTAIQTFIPAAGGATLDLFNLDWANVGQIVAGAVVLSILTSLLSGLNGTGPSAVNAEIKADAVVLDEHELDAGEAQAALDQMVVDSVEPDDGEDAPPEGLADDEVDGYVPKH